MSSPKPFLSPAIGIGLGLIAVSTASIFIRYALAAGAPALVVAAWRLTLASLVLLPLVLARRWSEVRALTPRQIGLALISGLFLALHFGTWITSLAYTPVANAAVLVSTSPLFVAVLAAVTLREKLTPALIAGLALALFGGAIVGVSDACQGWSCPALAEFLRGEAFLGNLLALAGAAAVAVYFTVGKALRASLSLLTYIFVTYSTAALALVTVVLAGGQPLLGYDRSVYLWLALLALIPQLVGHSAFNWALRYLPATYVSVTILGEPIGSTLLALWLLGERPSPLKVAGGILLLIGILVASRPARPPLNRPHASGPAEIES